MKSKTLPIALMTSTFFSPMATLASDEPRNLITNAELKASPGGAPSGWVTWAPRPALAPKSALLQLKDGNALSLEANGFASYGKWVTLVRGIEAGKFYRFDVLHKAEKIESEDVSVAVVLSWLQSEGGEGEIQRDYVDRLSAELPWRRSFRTLQAPPRAHSVQVELLLRWTRGGSVLWKEPKLVEVPPPPRRVIRVATTRIKPGEHPTVESNTQLMADMLDLAGREKPDIVLLSENLVDRGVHSPLLERAQTVPGPLTRKLSEKAKQHHTYVVTTLHELDGGLVYNTAVLVDREGKIAGKYRKVHLAMDEAEDGITPGSEYPVFETDFGRIGMLICWDNWFVETARALRLKGAEIILLPIAGDGVPDHWDVISRARAFDNGVYLVSSATVTDNPSRIINPVGDVLAEAKGSFGLAVKEIDLDQAWRVRYLSVGSGEGEGKSLYIKERRPDTYSILTGAGGQGSR